MADPFDGRALPLGGLLGGSVERLRARLGTPAVDRKVGPDRWLRYTFASVSLRVRCRGSRVASWTVDVSPGVRSLRDAAERAGVWPDCAPDETPASDVGLLRRPLPGPAGPAAHSLTAAVRGGRIVQLTAFDEPPDWLGDSGNPVAESPSASRPTGRREP